MMGLRYRENTFAETQSTALCKGTHPPSLTRHNSQTKLPAFPAYNFCRNGGLFPDFSQNLPIFALHQTDLNPLTTIDAFLTKWAASGAAERANAQLFVAELCGLLGVDAPQ